MFKYIKYFFILVIFCNILSCTDNKLTLGKKAPQFNVVTLDKDKYLPNFQGKYTYIIFWSATCMMCANELNILNSLKPKYENKINFIAINVDGEDGKLTDFLKENPITFQVVKDQLNITRDRYEVNGTPTSYLINSQGLIEGIYIGVQQEEKLVNIFNKKLNL